MNRESWVTTVSKSLATRSSRGDAPWFAKVMAVSPTRRGALKAMVGAVFGGLLSSAPAVARAGPELGEPSLRASENVRLDTGTVNGLTVDRYIWRDAAGRPRSASLVRYGQGRGGYAVQFSYQVREPDRGWRTVFLNPPRGRGDGGFGYFVSHEVYRTFDANVCRDGSNNCPIAHVHGDDDSPLGHGLPGSGRRVAVSRNQAVHEFALNYPHWGTTVPVREPSGGVTPSDPAKHRKYDLPVTIRWAFTSGQDYPHWSVTYDFSAVPVNRVSADVRGPYGVMIFDESDGRLTKLAWADKFKFATAGNSVSTMSDWTWNTPNTGARYNLLVAGQYEMGLVEDVPYRQSRTGNIWNDLRNTTSADGLGCPGAGWRMPCDWMWTYQSVQFENFSDGTPTHAKKLAWGSAAYVGTSKTFDDIGEPFDGYPRISYGVWITFDKSGGAKTRRLAASVRAGGQR